MSNSDLDITIVEETINVALSGEIFDISMDGAVNNLNSHVQNTDTMLDEGGINQVSASQLKEVYDNRPIWDNDLKVYWLQN
jgi:hypothetical protein